MMHFKLQPEPAKWEARCRRRGLRWLERNPNYERPKSYWTEFEPDLYQAFRGLCAYCLMKPLKGEMDHFVPIAKLKRMRRDHLAYEWKNFRYCASGINQRKSDHDVLDPFKVQNNWFQVILPSLQLVLTNKVPKTMRKKAEFTIEQLGLRDGEVVVRNRRVWFEMYQTGELTLAGLRGVAPLIAKAVQADLLRGKDWRDEA